MQKLQRSLRLAFMAATLALGGCTQNSDPNGTALRVQIFTGAYSSIPVHVADERGLFAKHGLTVEKLPANSSPAAIAAMVGGSMDIVESAADLVMANVDKGTDLKYLLSNESTNYVTVVVGDHVSIADEQRDYPAVVRQFAGKRVGVNAIGSTLHLTGLLMLEDAGLDADDVEFVATGTAATTMAAWRAGGVDVQITFAPVPELLETLGVAHTLMLLADDGPASLQFRGLYGGWVTTGDFIANRKPQADAFIAAMMEAIDWIRDPANAEAMLEIATRYAPVSGLSAAENRAVMQRMIEQYRRHWGYQISPQAIELWNQYALRFELATAPIAFDDIVYSGAPTCTESCR